jgi:hypothetical protein
VADLRGIAHCQLSQRVGGEWLLRVVPDGAAPKAAEIVELRRRVEQLLGASGRLAIEQTDLLAPESSGKFRLGYPMR